MTVRKSWARIEAWLAEHARVALDSLKPGATEKDIELAEKTLGVGKLPKDFVQSWTIHDGQNWKNRPPLLSVGVERYPLMPLEWVVSHWESWTGLLESGTFDGIRGTPRGPVGADWWNRRWVPIGVNGVGDLICLDLDPAKGGKIGQVIEVLHEDGDRTVLAPSLGKWLDKFATDLEAGVYKSDPEPPHGLARVQDV